MLLLRFLYYICFFSLPYDSVLKNVYADASTGIDSALASQSFDNNLYASASESEAYVCLMTEEVRFSLNQSNSVVFRAGTSIDDIEYTQSGFSAAQVSVVEQKFLLPLYSCIEVCEK